ncbi:MAG: radical SAM family heme chaperone HemW [Myxococcota bacterium]|nr:radical SAM family heme chaperone HemW [Myxococcota bacterium]
MSDESRPPPSRPPAKSEEASQVAPASAAGSSGGARSEPQASEVQEVGVYVHVPFCERICPYCDFAVVREPRLSREREAAYVDALLAELAARRERFAGRTLASLYLGGGTPSLLTPASVARLLEAVADAFPPAPGLEVTLEANPSTTEAARLPDFRAAGVDRLSLGIQSFDDRVLKRLGRAHRAESARVALRAARAAGFENLSIDLIFAAPGQRLADLERDLDETRAHAPEHVSAYALTVESGTPFALAERRGQLALADEEEAVAMFEAVEARLAAAGLARYEVSSYARPGFESRHNRRYWERRPVLGLGPSAWSSEPPDSEAPHGARRANVRELPTYLEHLAAGRPASEAGPERLDARTARGEAVFLALRTRRGLAAGPFAAEFGSAPRAFFGPEIQALTSAGLLVEEQDGSLRLTRRGRLLSDTVFERFV